MRFVYIFPFKLIIMQHGFVLLVTQSDFALNCDKKGKSTGCVTMLSHTPFYYLITHTARVSCVMMIVMITADCVNKTASMVTTTTYLNQNHTHIYDNEPFQCFFYFLSRLKQFARKMLVIMMAMTTYHLQPALLDKLRYSLGVSTTTAFSVSSLLLL